MLTKRYSLIVVLDVSCLLAGCGGGGDHSPPLSQATPFPQLHRLVQFCRCRLDGIHADGHGDELPVVVLGSVERQRAFDNICFRYASASTDSAADVAASVR